MVKLYSFGSTPNLSLNLLLYISGDKSLSLASFSPLSSSFQLIFDRSASSVFSVPEADCIWDCTDFLAGIDSSIVFAPAKSRSKRASKESRPFASYRPSLMAASTSSTASFFWDSFFSVLILSIASDRVLFSDLSLSRSLMIEDTAPCPY